MKLFSINKMDDLKLSGFFLDNIDVVRSASIRKGGRTSKATAEKVYSHEWYEEVEMQFSKCKRLADFSNHLNEVSMTVSEALHLWLESDCGQGMNDEQIFCDTKLIAYMLDHRFKGKLLSSEYRNKATRKIMWMLKEDSHASSQKSDYSKYIEYINNRGFFYDIILDELGTKDYWETVKDIAPQLAKFGLKYSSMPAAVKCYVEITVTLDQFSKENQEKVVFIHNTMSRP